MEGGEFRFERGIMGKSSYRAFVGFVRLKDNGIMHLRKIQEHNCIKDGIYRVCDSNIVVLEWAISTFYFVLKKGRLITEN